MKKTAILFAPGYEEVEALTAVDLLRRAGVTCDIISLDGSAAVTGSHGITVGADRGFDAADLSDYDGLVLPGGLKGTQNLASDGRVLTLLREFADAGKLTAAICAAPTVLGKAGVLKGKRAVCYPGMEDQLTGAVIGEEAVVTDGAVITSRGLGTAIPFALALVEYFAGAERAGELARSIVFR